MAQDNNFLIPKKLIHDMFVKNKDKIILIELYNRSNYKEFTSFSFNEFYTIHERLKPNLTETLKRLKNHRFIDYFISSTNETFFVKLDKI